MALKRTAHANWKGTLKDGSGSMDFGTYKNLNYGFTSRFENGEGTNPEELIAAAHAGCFTMAFNVALERAGFLPDYVDTDANVKFEKLDEGWRITNIHLVTTAKIDGISNDQFQEIANNSKNGCPISNALAAIPITLEANLT